MARDSDRRLSEELGQVRSDHGELSFDAGASEAGGTAMSAGNVPPQDAPEGTS